MISILKLIEVNKVVQSNNSLFQQTDKWVYQLWPLLQVVVVVGLNFCVIQLQSHQMLTVEHQTEHSKLSHNCPITAAIDEVTIETDSTQNCAEILSQHNHLKSN